VAKRIKSSPCHLEQLDWGRYQTLVKEFGKAPEEYRPQTFWQMGEVHMLGVLNSAKRENKSVEFRDGAFGWYVGESTPHREPYRHYSAYLPFVREFDHLGLIEKYPEYKSRQFLDSVLEINLLAQYCELKNGTVVLDLGGGYGRLAEFMLCEFEIRFILVEGVAISFFIAENYIPSILNVDLNSYWGRRDTTFSSEFSVWPAWKIEDALSHADIVINVHSLQEMGDKQCSHYLDVIDKHRKKNSFVFLRNRNGVATQQWTFPETWELLHEVFLSKGDWALHNPRRLFNKPTWIRIFR
jgi:hypothetical protein